MRVDLQIWEDANPANAFRVKVYPMQIREAAQETIPNDLLVVWLEMEL